MESGAAAKRESEMLNHRAIALSIAPLLLAAAAAAQNAAAVVASPPAASPYAGSQACQTCHEDLYNGVMKSPHAAVETDRRRGFAGGRTESLR